MLIRRDVLEAIAAGRVTTLFRTWSKPMVRAGGTQRTSVGVVAIDAVEPAAAAALTEEDARAAGYPTLTALREDVGGRKGTLYRIGVRLAGPDPRIALRAQSRPSSAEVAQLLAKLSRLDEASSHGPWTSDVLLLLSERPAVRAPDLAASRGIETVIFKRDVRKLKELGLTEGLVVGYRPSPRGRAVIGQRRMRAAA
jgi:hypothetical protein